tara:strand:- start:1035 stop:1811 length:777 start_codon:yes stop_codon:yes gene_type:complete
MAIETREDLDRAIADRGRSAVEQELRSGDFGVSLSDISDSLYLPWAREKASGMIRGNPVSGAFGRSAQTALGRLTGLKAAVRPEFELAGREAFSNEMKKARVDAQKLAQKAMPGISQGYRSALEGLARARGNRLQSANLEGGSALGILGGGLGIAGGVLSAIPVTAPIGIALSAAGAGTGLAGKAAQDAEQKRIAKLTQSDLTSAGMFKGPEVRVDKLDLPSSNISLAGSSAAPRFNLLGQEDQDYFSNALRGFQMDV